MLRSHALVLKVQVIASAKSKYDKLQSRVDTDALLVVMINNIKPNVLYLLNIHCQKYSI